MINANQVQESILAPKNHNQSQIHQRLKNFQDIGDMDDYELLHNVQLWIDENQSRLHDNAESINQLEIKGSADSKLNA